MTNRIKNIFNDNNKPEQDDFDKTKRVVKLWLGKMGFDVKKATIEKTPRFKKK